MPAIQRALAGQALRFDLDAERNRAHVDPIHQRAGRNARTLVKEDGLRITLVTLASGGEIAAHQADGPISIQCLEGDVQLDANGDGHSMVPGTLVTLPAGAPHALTSRGGGAFLLTVAWTPDAS